MGKFDGILICSDIDGTFQRKAETGEVNAESVRYFIENGGKFTFATGRSVSTLKESGLSRFVNAPIVNLSGGIIYDYAQDKLLCESRLGFTTQKALDELGEYVCENTNIYVFNGSEKADTTISIKSELTEDIKKITPIKLYFEFKTEPEADAFENAALHSEFLKDYFISKSWRCGVEIDCKDRTKGDGMNFIRDYLGGIHTTIGVGNFGNDSALLERADIAVAVDDADEKIKEIADIIVRPCEEYAIKHLIEILDAKY